MRDRPAEEPATTVPVSCCLSATGLRFLGILFPPETSAPLTVGLPPPGRCPATDPDRVPTFRTPEIRPGPGVLCAPRAAVLTRPGGVPDRRLPLPSGQPLVTPVTQPVPGCGGDETSTKDSLPFAQPGLPLACDPRTEQGPLGFPWASHPARQDPATHARAGTGSSTARTTLPASADLLQRNHSPRATSRRNSHPPPPGGTPRRQDKAP